jgi:hypothetical protein
MKKSAASIIVSMNADFVAFEVLTAVVLKSCLLGYNAV